MRLSQMIRLRTFAVRLAVPLILTTVACGAALANPVGVTYTVTGTAGDWTLDFSFSNNVSGQVLYFFGVALPTQDVLNSPAGFVNCYPNSPCTNTTLNPSSLSGGLVTTTLNETFNNLWRTPSGSADTIAFGNTESGFEVGVTTAAAPTSVDWFAFTADLTGNSPYLGSQNFPYSGDCATAFDATCASQSQENPLFSGSATPTPEPSSLALLSGGLFGLVSTIRRRYRRL